MSGAEPGGASLQPGLCLSSYFPPHRTHRRAGDQEHEPSQWSCSPTEMLSGKLACLSLPYISLCLGLSLRGPQYPLPGPGSSGEAGSPTYIWGTWHRVRKEGGATDWRGGHDLLVDKIRIGSEAQEPPPSPAALSHPADGLRVCKATEGRGGRETPLVPCEDDEHSSSHGLPPPPEQSPPGCCRKSHLPAARERGSQARARREGGQTACSSASGLLPPLPPDSLCCSFPPHPRSSRSGLASGDSG